MLLLAAASAAIAPRISKAPRPPPAAVTPPPSSTLGALSTAAAGKSTVLFIPSFKAARRARGVVRRPPAISEDESISEYVVSPRAHPAEIRAMLNGLVSTSQLEAAAHVLSTFLNLGGGVAVGDRGIDDGERLASIVLNGCAEAGRMDLSGDVIKAMRAGGVPLGDLTFCILIKGYGRRGDVRRVQLTYEAMGRANVTPDLATLNALLDAFAANGKLTEAEEVLTSMLDGRTSSIAPSARSFNTLIKGYARLGQMREAFNVVRRMREALGPDGPNEVTYSTLIHALVRRGELRRARQILTWMGGSSTRLQPDAWAYTSLMRGLLPGVLQRSGLDVGAAKSRNGGGSAAQARANVSALAVAASAEAADVEPGSAEAADEALALLEEMIAVGVLPNAATVSTVLGGCFAFGHVAQARAAAAAVREVASSTGNSELASAADDAMIVGLCRPPSQVGRVGDGMGGDGELGGGEARNRMQLREALRLFISSCQSAAGGQTADDDGDKAAGGKSRKSRAPRACVRTCNALLSALVASGETESAVSVLEAMDRGAADHPNAYSLCIMMRAHGARGRIRQAHELWTRLCELRWVDTVGLNTYLSACMANGEQRRALQAFQTVKVDSPGVALDKVTFGTLINGLTTSRSTRAGTRRALQLWAEMRELGIAPDEGIVASLFSGIRRWLDVEYALRLRLELRALGWRAHQLRTYDEALRECLPSLAEVMGNLPYWEALGVRPQTSYSSLSSEVGELALDDGQPAADAAGLNSVRPVPEPASVGEEIWERKGWNQIDSGWHGFF